MAEDVTSLVLNVKTDSVEKAVKELKELEKVSKSTERASDMLVDSSKDLNQQQKQTNQGNKKLAESTKTVGSQAKTTKKATDKLTDSLDKTEDSAEDLTRENKKLASSFGGLKSKILASVAAIGGVAIAVKGVKASIAAFAEIETLETSFVSLTGSVENARKEVALLTQFTASTPFKLEGVATAARQLITARGTTEGLREELTLLGDISATTGKPINELASIYAKTFNKGKVQAEELNQISEAGIPIIAQLAEQFGVSRNEVFKLGSDGKIQFEDLREAFVAFTSEGGFAFDAMIRQSETLNGRLSTLEDSVKLAAAGIGGKLVEALNLKEIISDLTTLVDVIAEFNKSESDRVVALETGNALLLKRFELEDSIRKLEKEGFDYGEQAKALALVNSKFEQLTFTQKKEAFLQNSIREGLKLQRRALDEINDAATSPDRERYLENVIEQQRVLNKSHREELVTLRETVAVEEQRLTATEGILKVRSGLSTQFDEIAGSLRTQSETIEESYELAVKVVEEYQTNLKKTGDLTIEEQERINEAFDRLAERRREALNSILEVNTTAPGISRLSVLTPDPPKEPKKRKKSTRRSGGGSRKSEFDQLKEELARENQIVEQSYLRRLELIRKNTAEGSKARFELEMQLGKQYAEQASQELSAFQNELSGNTYETQLQQIEAFYSKRKELILNASILTEQEKNAAILELDRERAVAEEQANRERWEMAISGTQDFLSDLESIQTVFGKRGAEIAKGAAIANATINTAQNAILAYQRGLEIPFLGGPIAGAAFAAAAIAAGTAQIAVIKSQSVGNFESGGIVGGSSYTGDRLTANVNSAEMILNRQQQKQLFDVANGRNSGSTDGTPNVYIINQTQTSFEGEATRTENGDFEIIVRETSKRVEQKLTKEANSGGGSVVPAIAQNFGLRRTGSN